MNQYLAHRWGLQKEQNPNVYFFQCKQVFYISRSDKRLRECGGVSREDQQ